MKVIATLERLAAYQSNNAKLFGTPDNNGNIAQTYWSNSANFTNDYVVATVADFQEAMGFDACEISYEEVQEMGADVYEIEL